VANALWAELWRLAVEIGAWRIRLLVDPDNRGARAFYGHAGMSERPLILFEGHPTGADDPEGGEDPP
jgi:ribosomal protein S18 acetylase RimI-like enzyme